MWEVYSLSPSDTQWGISRTVVNAQGRFQLEKFTKTFKNLESAVAKATRLNSVA